MVRSFIARRPEAVAMHGACVVVPSIASRVAREIRRTPVAHFTSPSSRHTHTQVFMVPTSDALPEIRAWMPTDAQLQWNYKRKKVRQPSVGY